MSLGRARSAVVPAAGVFAALVVGGLLIAAIGKNPFTVYGLLLHGTFGSWYGIGQVLSKATPLLFTGLAVAVAFRGGLFNVGAEGQMTVGGLFSALAALGLAGWPAWVVLPAALAAAAAGGAALGGLAGWLKSRRGVHEVIATIMLNFIAFAAANALLLRIAVPATVRTELLPEAAWLPRLSTMLAPLPVASGIADGLRASPVSAAALLGIGAAVAVGAWLAATPRGFETRAVGAGAAAAATAGIDVGATVRRTLGLSGALAGLASAGFVLGNKHYYETGFAAGAGFMGIAVALVGRNHPLGIVPAALLFGALSHGGLVVNAEIPSEIVSVLQALVILFVVCGLGRPSLRRRGVLRA